MTAEVDPSFRQLQVLRLIWRSREERGLSPTLRELAEELGVTKVTVHGHLQECERHGWLEVTEPFRDRNRRLTREGRKLLGARPASHYERLVSGWTGCNSRQRQTFMDKHALPWRRRREARL